MVIGGHSDTGMIPLTRLATRNSVPVSAFLSADKLETVSEETKVGGATLTKLLGTSAWYAPACGSVGHGAGDCLRHQKMFPCSCLLEGEYGLSDICIGAPAIIGKNGIEQIVEIELDATEKAKLAESADAVRKTNGLL